MSNKEENLNFEYALGREKLINCKNENIKIIAVDYDGTVYDRYDPNFNKLEKVVMLAKDVYNSGMEFAFISGRSTTLELELRDLGSKISKDTGENFSIWRSGGTGMNLDKLSFTCTSDEVEVENVYSNSLSFEEVKLALNEFLKLKIEADTYSKSFFNNFLEKDLPEYLVPREFKELAVPYEGLFFAEKVKITFVLPKNEDEQERCVEVLRKKLEKYGLSVGWGRLPFADVSKQLILNGESVDGKMYMVKMLIKRLNINENQVVTFGDSPKDNNKGLLSFPYSFTNDMDKGEDRTNLPPYLLKVNKSPIKAVYDAISYLIFEKNKSKYE